MLIFLSTCGPSPQAFLYLTSQSKEFPKYLVSYLRIQTWLKTNIVTQNHTITRFSLMQSKLKEEKQMLRSLLATHPSSRNLCSEAKKRLWKVSVNPLGKCRKITNLARSSEKIELHKGPWIAEVLWCLIYVCSHKYVKWKFCFKIYIRFKKVSSLWFWNF